MSILILALACSLLPSPDELRADGDWRYIRPGPGDPFDHPPFRALALSTTPPEDLVEAVNYRGRSRRYARIRFGTVNATRASVVLDDVAPGIADLYLDADRKGRIEPGDRLEPSGDRRTWRVFLEPASGLGEARLTDLSARGVVFQLGSTGLTLGFAAAGYVEGRVEVGGKSHPARRVDGDGNGRFNDPRDRLWIDLDDDGRWTSAVEEFPFAPILSIAGDRHSARTDALGRRLELARLDGSGTIRLGLDRPVVEGSVTELNAVLIGRDGSAVAVDGSGSVVPVGEYRLASTQFTIRDAGGSSWSYLFSDANRRGEPIWHEVGRDQVRRIDPVGAVELRIEDGPEGPIPAGNLVDVQPALFNGDGLRIVAVTRRSDRAGDRGPTAEVALRSSDRIASPIEGVRSGFS